MLKLIGNIPRHKPLYLAFSGGVDSMAIFHFLVKGKHNFTVAFFNHNTTHCNETEKTIIDLCNRHAIDYVIGRLSRDKLKEESIQEYWRAERYKFLNNLNGLVITGHQLDDVLETWIHSCMSGNPKIIPAINNNVIRPFLLTKKQEFIDWCNYHNITWLEDESNKDVKFTRNKIRHEILPLMNTVSNMYSMMYKKVKDKYNDRNIFKNS